MDNCIIPIELCQIIMSNNLLSVCYNSKSIPDEDNILKYVFEYICTSHAYSKVCKQLYNMFCISSEKNICKLINFIPQDEYYRICEEIMIELFSKLLKKKNNIGMDTHDIFYKYISESGLVFLFINCYRIDCNIWTSYCPNVEKLVDEINIPYYDEMLMPIKVFMTNDAMNYVIDYSVNNIDSKYNFVRKIIKHIFDKNCTVKYDYDVLFKILKILDDNDSSDSSD
jgi:hypothetical protein